MIAFKCINYRGAIAHGKKTELSYQYDCVVAWEKSTNARDVFYYYGGGSKELKSIEEIKDEIMQNGPVVSSSFHFSQAFLNAGDHSHLFEANLMDQRHAILIVGWKQIASGEMWLARTSKSSTKNDDDISIAMGQFSLEVDVHAPSCDLSDRYWQNNDRAFDIPNIPTDWYSWFNIQSRCSGSDLERLFKALGCSWKTATSSKQLFVVRDPTKKARSRYAYLTDIEWIEASNDWDIDATFCDQEWESP